VGPLPPPPPPPVRGLALASIWRRVPAPAACHSQACGSSGGWWRGTLPTGWAGSAASRAAGTGELPACLQRCWWTAQVPTPPREASLTACLTRRQLVPRPQEPGVQGGRDPHHAAQAPRQGGAAAAAPAAAALQPRRAGAAAASLQLPRGCSRRPAGLLADNGPLSCTFSSHTSSPQLSCHQSPSDLPTPPQPTHPPRTPRPPAPPPPTHPRRRSWWRSSCTASRWPPWSAC